MLANINGTTKETSLSMDYALKALINGAVELGVLSPFQAVETWNDNPSINEFTDAVILAAWHGRTSSNGKEIHSKILKLAKKVSEELYKEWEAA